MALLYIESFTRHPGGNMFESLWTIVTKFIKKRVVYKKYENCQIAWSVLQKRSPRGSKKDPGMLPKVSKKMVLQGVTRI